MSAGSDDGSSGAPILGASAKGKAKVMEKVVEEMPSPRGEKKEMIMKMGSAGEVRSPYAEDEMRGGAGAGPSGSGSGGVKGAKGRPEMVREETKESLAAGKKGMMGVEVVGVKKMEEKAMKSKEVVPEHDDEVVVLNKPKEEDGEPVVGWKMEDLEGREEGKKGGKKVEVKNEVLEESEVETPDVFSPLSEGKTPSTAPTSAMPSPVVVRKEEKKKEEGDEEEEEGEMVDVPLGDETTEQKTQPLSKSQKRKNRKRNKANRGGKA